MPEEKKNDKIKETTLLQEVVSTFFKEDIKSVMKYVVLEVIIPGAKRTFLDSVNRGFSQLLNGTPTTSYGNSLGDKASVYHRLTTSDPWSNTPSTVTTTVPSSSVTRSNSFRLTNIRVASKTDCDKLMSRIESDIANYGYFTVGSLYDFLHIPGCPTTGYNWGWKKQSIDKFGFDQTVLGDYRILVPEPYPVI